MDLIAIYGEPGSYSEQAAIQYFGRHRTKFKYCKFLPELFEAVEDGSDFGIVPIENSLEGAVTQTYDSLLESNLAIIGEEIVRISHCLMAPRSTRLGDVTTVYSHPQALSQCRDYIESHRLNTVPFYDTAGSAKMLKEKRLKNSAAIASQRAAEVYSMKILARNIQSNRHNYTRFVVVSKKDKTGVKDKTTIAFSAKNEPGSLFRALNAFAHNKVNLLYIQSRPIPGMPWEYNFYVDCDCGISEPRIKRAIRELYDASDFVKILGSYRRARFDLDA